MSKKNWLLFISVGLLWGMPYLLLKVSVRELSVPVIVCSRTLIGALILVPIALHQRTIIPALKKFHFVLLYAVLELFLPWVLITSAEQKVPSGLAGLLVATVPIWASILASFSGDKTVWHSKRLAGMIVGFIGVLLVVGIESINSKQNPIAIGMILVASLCYALAIFTFTRNIPEIDPIATNGLAMLTTAIFYLPFALLALPKHAPSSHVILSQLALGIFPTALAFILFFELLRDVGQARASLVTYLNTAFAVVLGIVILKEPLTPGIIFGLPLVLIGSYFAGRKSVTQ
jgi:drug/metabolite transporter (DMT)-like permease